jgi:hypothetical protein
MLSIYLLFKIFEISAMQFPNFPVRFMCILNNNYGIITTCGYVLDELKAKRIHTTQLLPKTQSQYLLTTRVLIVLCKSSSQLTYDNVGELTVLGLQITQNTQVVSQLHATVSDKSCVL